MRIPTKRVNKFKLLCMSKGLQAQDIVDAVKEATGEEIAKATIYAYFQGMRFPTEKNMNLLIAVFGEEVLDCFYEKGEQDGVC